MGVIYGLFDPTTDVLRYVGKAEDPHKRLRVHISNSKRGLKTHTNEWIRSLLKVGLVPVQRILEQVSGDSSEREKYWISYYRSQGYDLTNLTDGGEGTHGWVPSETTRQKIASALSGKKLPVDSPIRMKLSKIHLGSVRPPRSEAHKQKLSEARKHQVIVHSAETRKKMSESRKGIKFTPEHLRAMSEAQKGKTVTMETRRKISAYWASRREANV